MRKSLPAVRNPVLLDNIPGNIQQCRDVIWPFFDEANHQGVVSEAQFLEVSKLHKVLGQCLELVVMESEGPKVGEVGELFGKMCESVITEDKGSKPGHLPHLDRKLFQLISSQVQIVEPTRK